MKIVAFHGSPRIGGNTDILLDAFLKGAETGGASVEKITLMSKRITPCIECGQCDTTGVCVLEDDMTPIYDKIREADIVVVASPIFFYNITSYTQALVERSQACWIGKYVLKTGPYGGKERKGIFLSLGATKGKMLFDGVLRVMKYFFDAISASFAGALLYRGIEKKGDVKKHPTALTEAEELGSLVATGADLDSFAPLYIPGSK